MSFQHNTPTALSAAEAKKRWKYLLKSGSAAAATIAEARALYEEKKTEERATAAGDTTAVAESSGPATATATGQPRAAGGGAPDIAKFAKAIRKKLRQIDNLKKKIRINGGSAACLNGEQAAKLTREEELLAQLARIHAGEGDGSGVAASTSTDGTAVATPACPTVSEEPCWRFQKGTCKKGDACLFAHISKEDAAARVAAAEANKKRPLETAEAGAGNELKRLKANWKRLKVAGADEGEIRAAKKLYKLVKKQR